MYIVYIHVCALHDTAMVYYFASSDCVNSRSVASVSPRSTFQRGSHHTVKKGIHVHCTYVHTVHIHVHCTYINFYILSIYMYMYNVHTLISTYCREIRIQFMCIMCVAHKQIGKSSQTVTVL